MFTEVQVVQHRAQRVVSGWSQQRAPERLRGRPVSFISRMWKLVSRI
jgi:hypothetical protein